MITLAGAAAVSLAFLLGQAPRRPPTFPSVTAVVRLDVLAPEPRAGGRELTPNDFDVRDNGVLQTVHVSPASSWHWEVVVLLDTSDSVRGLKLDAFRACVRAVSEALREGDQAALVTFSDVVQLRATMTASRPLLRQALDDLRADGSTALFDALFSALAMSGNKSSRPLLILLTDGRDTVSWLSANDVIAVARLCEATVYVVSTTSIGRLPRPPAGPPTWASVAATPDDDFLRRLTDATGGRLLHAESAERVQAQLAAVLNDIRARYIITYEPVGVATDGWHDVQVRLKQKGGTIVVRPGYFLTPGSRKGP